jgi:O-succinylbenzoate synthase
VTSVELRRVRLPLRTAFRSAHGTESVRDAVLVRFSRDDGVEGWGECGAATAPTYWYEYAEGAWTVLRDELVPRFLCGRDLDEITGHPMAKAALRMARLDADLRSDGRSLADHLGATRDAVPAGVAVGLDEDVAAAVDAGYRWVKLKIEPGAEERVARARADHPRLGLFADANGSYGREDLDRLRRLDDLLLTAIEQPLPSDDIEGLADVSRALRTPVCLDESAISPGLVAAALDLGAGAAVSVKLARLGGIDAAVAVHDLCVSRGVAARVGGLLETGIGRAAAVALAALPGFTMAPDLSASDRYWETDLTDPIVLVDGHLSVPKGPGIGAEVHVDVVDRFTVGTWRSNSTLASQPSD